jgi:hypothetical protein
MRKVRGRSHALAGFIACKSEIDPIPARSVYCLAA